MVRRDMRGASPLSFLVQHGKLPRIFLLVDVRARLNIEQYEQLHSPVELSEAGGVPGGLNAQFKQSTKAQKVEERAHDTPRTQLRRRFRGRG